jgi:hypothetical protein
LTQTHAAVPIVDANGILTGASGVMVNGVSYNVTFEDGSCPSLFSGCTDTSNLNFQTEPDAINAINALASQVLVDTPFGKFGTQPGLIRGCTDPTLCQILIPFSVFPTGNFFGIFGVFWQIAAAGSGYTQGLNTFEWSPAIADTTCGVSNSALNCQNVMFSVWQPSRTPAAELAALLAEVTGVGPGKSLANKVAFAQTYYAVPDVQSTCAVLTDFVNEVKAQAGKKIGQSLDAKLISDALAIEAAIGCQ